jgi:hypothetical protein
MRQVRKPVKKVRLETEDLSQEFEVSHAERILDMGPAVNGGWHVPEDSEYEYTEEYGLRLKSNKENSATKA